MKWPWVDLSIFLTIPPRHYGVGRKRCPGSWRFVDKVISWTRVHKTYSEPSPSMYWEGATCKRNAAFTLSQTSICKSGCRRPQHRPWYEADYGHLEHIAEGAIHIHMKDSAFCILSVECVCSRKECPQALHSISRFYTADFKGDAFSPGSWVLENHLQSRGFMCGKSRKVMVSWALDARHLLCALCKLSKMICLHQSILLTNDGISQLLVTCTCGALHSRLAKYTGGLLTIIITTRTMNGTMNKGLRFILCNIK